MAQYVQSSPYFNTPITDGYLDVLTFRSIPKQADDIVFTITTVYDLRPDKLAFDLYGDANLWWVFLERNPNTMEDPVYDFTVGKTIYLPKLETLKTALGL